MANTVVPDVLNTSKLRSKLERMKKPPDKPKKSVQLELFTQFVTNDQSSVSNTIELWERIPKYFFTTKGV